jgi:two-component system response regulator DegU
MPDKKLQLLIADDHRIFTEGLQQLLKHALQAEIKGIALNGKEAIEKCGQTDIDAIIMDIHMPVIDGIQATHTIKQLYPCIKVIIISTSDDMNTITHALKAGADAYVLKDEGSEDLLAAFKTISKDEIFISSSIAHLFTAERNRSKTMEKCIQFAENLITPR